MTLPVRVLLIEDDPVEARALESACREVLESNLAVAIATSADEARLALGGEEFDLIVCDLALPANAGAIHPERDHGLGVFKAIQSEFAGTPVIVLSGHADLHIVREFLDAARTADLFGTGVQYPMVQFFPKEDLPDCVRAVRPLLEGAASAAEFPVQVPADLELSPSETRVLQIFGRRSGGTELHATSLSGGLSEAKTLRVEVLAPGGVRRALVAAKLGRRDRVLHERARYDQVAGLLPVGLGAPLIRVVEAGAGRGGGVFYRLAHEHTRTLFECLEASPTDGAKVAWKLRSRFREWYESAPTAERPMSDIRRGFISDIDLYGLEHDVTFARELDDRRLLVGECMQHGDLHGLNVLVDEHNEPVVIDYGDVRRANGAVDPVTLELSAVFHPAAQSSRGDWPTDDQIEAWWDLEGYRGGCVLSEFIVECREWASDVVASEQELDATVLGYALRQLKYRNPTDDLALRLARSAAARLREA